MEQGNIQCSFPPSSSSCFVIPHSGKEVRDDDQLRDAFLEALLQTLCCLHSTHSPSDLQGHLQRAFPSIIWVQQVNRRAYHQYVIGVSAVEGKQKETLQQAPHHLFPTSFPPTVYCSHQSRFLPTKACYTCPTYLSSHWAWYQCALHFGPAHLLSGKNIGKLSIKLGPVSEDPLSQCCVPSVLPGKSKTRHPGSESFASNIHQWKTCFKWLSTTSRCSGKSKCAIP